MNNFLRARVRERLSALGLNPFEAARRMGDESELSVRAIIGGTLRAGWNPAAESIQQADGEVIARVVFAHRVFGNR